MFNYNLIVDISNGSALKKLNLIFSKKELAEILGVSVADLKSSNYAHLCAVFGIKIMYLYRLIWILSGIYNEYGIRRWFKRKRVQLGNKSPIEILKKRKNWRKNDIDKIDEIVRWLIYPSAT